MEKQQIISELETNYSYEFDKTDKNGFSWLVDFANDVQEVVKGSEPDICGLNNLEVKELIKSEAKQGNVVSLGVDGLNKIAVTDLLDQPAEGILYDLNRDSLTALTLSTDPKWINDYAVGVVITQLCALLEEIKEELKRALEFASVGGETIDSVGLDNTCYKTGAPCDCSGLCKDS